ncbi:metal-dependent transcriptional regulator [Mycoplasmatota bacterium]|nr:metal-dependent transcriptional regulator [Mycoplasmatota bacterium]
MYRAEEDYIKNIYKLTVEKNKKIVKNNELAEVLGFTDQTVNEMIKKLVTKKLVSFIPYKGVSLTSKGLNESIRLVRNHRLWEVFLVNHLNYKWTEVHEEAEKLEHASSDLLIENLFKYLKQPVYCVHGNAIPNLDGSVAKTFDFSLSDCNPGDVFILKRVMDQPKLLKFLDEKNIRLYSILKIVGKDTFNGMIEISYLNETFYVSLIIADKLFGELES